jgi:polysaccharide biosynthesis protein PslH
MGIPVVATSEAAKGIAAVPGRDLMVADDDETFARTVVDLLQNAQLRRELSRAARRRIENVNLWSASMSLVDRILRDVPVPGAAQEVF